MTAIDYLRSVSRSSQPDESAVAGLLPAEVKLLGFVLATGFCSALYSAVRQQIVDWPDFLPTLRFAMVLVLVGMSLRILRIFARTALCIIAFGLASGFLVVCGILTMTVMPFSNPMVDQTLFRADDALGFSWVNSIKVLSEFPTVSFALKFVYVSLLPQLAFVIILLCHLKRKVELHRFLMLFFLSMVMSTAIWWLVPSVGPAAYAHLSLAVEQKASLIANAEYGQKMWHYANVGNEVITRSVMAGVVAFPSMHIASTCMVLWFTQKTYMFYPLLAFNAVMPVATVLHGGHHVIDIFGGVFVFVVCIICSFRLLPQRFLT